MTTTPRVATLTSSPWTTAPKNRANVIRTILTHHTELVDPGVQLGYSSIDGGYPHTDPRVYTPTVREVERLLRTMRDDRHESLLDLLDKNGAPTGERASVRACWWHINEYHLRATTILVTPAKQPRSKKRELRRLPTDDTGRPLPAKRTIRNPTAREDLAELGITWIATHWALTHEPMVPQELAA